MHAPRDIGRLDLLVRPCIGRDDLGRIGEGRLAADARPVDDRVPRDGVQPRCAGPAVRSVARGGAPDRGEGLLNCFFGATAVAEHPQRQAVDRPRETAVEDVEGCGISIGDSL